MEPKTTDQPHTSRTSKARATGPALQAMYQLLLWLLPRWRSGQVDASHGRPRIAARVAHAPHANTVQLRHTLFAGGWFDPLWAGGTPAKACMP